MNEYFTLFGNLLQINRSCNLKMMALRHYHLTPLYFMLENPPIYISFPFNLNLINFKKTLIFIMNSLNFAVFHKFYHDKDHTVSILKVV